MIGLLLSLALVQQDPVPPSDSVKTLGDIVVTARPPTGLLQVTVDGATDARTLVVTEPDLRCGDESFRWETYGRPRLCWLRRERGSVIVLSATASGRPGVDWGVDWTGCSRVIGIDRCEVTLEAANTVRVTFRTLAAREPAGS